MNSINRDVPVLQWPARRPVRPALDVNAQGIRLRPETSAARRRGWLVRRALLAADVVGLVTAFLTAEMLYAGADANVDHVHVASEVIAFLATLPIWIVMAHVYKLYDRDEERTDHSTVDDVVGVFHLVTGGAWLVFAGAWLTNLAEPNLPKLATFWVLAIGLITVGRVLARAVCRRSLTYLQNTIIVGAGEVGQLIARKLLQHPEYGINLVGFVDDAPRSPRADLDNVTVLGTSEQLPAIVRRLDVERVVIAFSNDSHEQSLAQIRRLKDLDVQVDIVPRLFEIVGPGVGIHAIEGVPLVGLRPLRLSRSSRCLKRSVDLVGAVLGLIAFSPLFAVIALLIRRSSPGPVFFRQVRMGTGDRTFRIYKFRTMSTDADQRKHELAHLNMHARNGGDPRMFKVPADPRVTPLGRFLRRYSLDELPQLINVLKGEMSLVGPRPLILDEDRCVADWARKRLNLKPGVTGLWQVLGSSSIPFEEMTKLDYLYVTNWSLATDLSLICRTIPALIKPRPAY